MACLSNEVLDQMASGAASSEPTLHLTTCASCRTRLLERLRQSAMATTGHSEHDVTAPSGEGSRVGPRAPLDGPRYVTGPQAEVLGRGGYGKVLLARDGLVGRDVALKCLRSRARATPEQAANAEERLLREARVAGQLEHPGIVPLYDLGRAEDGSLFYTMRRIRGRTLEEAASACPDFAARLRLLPNVLATCHAIAYAHSRGVVHRDLKPQNVMVDRFGSTVVIDWGLASVRGTPDVEDPTTSVVRLVDDAVVTRAHGRLGTPAYMSPEQQTGVRALIDEKSDVWGLGGILFEVLTGQAPRSIENPEAAPTPVHQLLPECPRDLAALCDKALASSRDERYQSAEALAADLDAWLHGREVTAHAYRPSELLARFVREYRLPIAVASIALAVLMTIGGVAFWRVRDERNRARDFGLAMLEDVLPRMTSLGDAAFLSAFTARIETWLDATEGEGNVAVGRAWQQLANVADSEETALHFAQRCLAMAGTVGDVLDRKALLEVCTVLRLRHEEAPLIKARLAAYLQMLEQPLAPEAMNHVPSMMARSELLMAAAWASARLGLDDSSYNRQSLELVRRALVLKPGDLRARQAMIDALSNEAEKAAARGDAEAAVKLAEESVREARALLRDRRSPDSLMLLAYVESWSVTLHCWYDGVKAPATVAAARETRQTLDVLSLMNARSPRVQAMTLSLLLDLDETRELEQVVRETDPHALTPNDRIIWQYAAVATGHARDVLAHTEWLESAGFDVHLAFTVAALDSGDRERAVKWARATAAFPVTTMWSVTGLSGWAARAEGPLADEARAFVAKMGEAQRTGNTPAMTAALRSLADGLDQK